MLVVDPPSGWLYGFPAVWDKEKYPEIADFFRSKGYPERDIDFACSYCRCWEHKPINKGEVIE